jgi:hypothetical protein
MENNRQVQYKKIKGHTHIAPLNEPWEEDLWYYEVFDPKYLLNKLKLSYEKGKKNGGNMDKQEKLTLNNREVKEKR